jgi:hypothetical protein
MSKTWEHYDLGAHHHARAAHNYQEASKYSQAEEHEKAMHHAYLAHGHSQSAIQHETEAARLHAEECESSASPSVRTTVREEAA